MIKSLIVCTLIFCSMSLTSQVFTLIKDQPPGLVNAAATWIDVNGNLRKDLIISGDYQSGNKGVIRTVFFKQADKERFSIATKGLPELTLGAVAAGDLNNDGRQDLVISGQSASGRFVSGIYMAQADGSLRKSDALLATLIEGSIALADIDKDNDLDILMSGKDEQGKAVTKVYRNDNGKFTDINAPINGIMHGQAVFGDINNDGYPDILVCGLSNSGPVTRLFLNNQGRFIPLTNHFLPLKNSSAAFADFDKDSWTDLIISGENSNGRPVLRIYRNLKNNMFDEVTSGSIRPLMNSTIETADFNVDGLVDFVITGESLERPYSYVYQNMGNFVFRDIMAGLTGVSAGTAVWGDFDNDGDPDLFISGLDVCYDFIGQIYRNNTNPEIEREESASIFIESPIIDYSQGPYFYFLFSSCFCDPENTGTKRYHMFISKVHREEKDFDLNYRFNEILTSRFPNWEPADRAHRTSNAFPTAKEAEEARLGVIESYKAEGYQIHYFNW